MNGFPACRNRLSDGSTVTAGDVAAVMKLIELRLPLVLYFLLMIACSALLRGRLFYIVVYSILRNTTVHENPLTFP